MKIAYLTSLYPAVSHTFILREVKALRTRGVDIKTFTVRRANRHDALGENALHEATNTQPLIPPPLFSFLLSVSWVLVARPVRAWRALMTAVSGPGRTVGQRLKWLCYFGEAVLLARWLVTREFTHLHCHFGNSGASTGMLAAQLADIPFSMTCHGSELENIDGHRLPQKVKQAAFVACVSEYGKTKLTAVTPASEWSKLYIVRCGLHEFPVPSRPPANDVPRILCVGRLAPEKGHHVLLDALATLRTKGVDFACTLIGDGPRRAALESRVDALRLRSAVTLTGSRKPEEVARAYAGANVVVLASFSEGVPVVLMEAMAHARPVVATRVGGVPELVRDGLTGVLVESGDAEGLADALQRILSDPEWAADLAEKAARHVRSEFNLEASVDRLIELFDSAARTTQQSAIRQPDATVCHSGP